MHLITLNIIMPFWHILELGKLESQKLLVNFLGLLDDSLAREVFFHFIAVKIIFFLKHFASIERMIPWLENCLRVLHEVFFELN